MRQFTETCLGLKQMSDHDKLIHHTIISLYMFFKIQNKDRMALFSLHCVLHFRTLGTGKANIVQEKTE